MSEEFKLPKPFLFHDKPAEFTPVDTVGEASKIAIYSAIFMGGMHVRRLLQHRMGAARPGQQRYLALFELSPRHFVSIPLALASYSFVSSSLYNLDEVRSTNNEMMAAGAGILMATVFKKGPLNQKIGLAVGVATAVGIFKWAGGLIDNYNTNYTYMTQNGLINNQESNKTLDEQFANGTYKKQGFWELVYRKPLSETIADLGEGRGIGKL